MKKTSILKHIIIIFTLLFILIPSNNVKAKTKATTYNHYYFFIEEFTVGEVQNIINGKTTNYTIFPGIKLGAVPKGGKIIPITTNCSSSEGDNCWRYVDFYKMYLETENKGTIENVEEIENNTTKYYIKNNNYYYIHGRYSSGDNIWQDNTGNLSDKFDINSNKSLVFACASIGVKTDENPSEVVLRNNDVEKKIQMKIIRNFFGGYNIASENLNLNNDITSCDKIYPVKIKENGKNIVLSPVVYKYTYTVTEEVCETNLEKSDKGKCNSGGNTLSSTCQKETITTSNARADVKINQKGTIANILTPENIHQGGGFKLAFVYYNEISWDFTGEILTKLGSKSAATNEIISEMKKKIQKVDDFEESILLDNISFGNRNKYESLNSALIQKKCQRTGEFNPGETVTTVCTFYLPNSVIDSYTGKVSYNNSIGTNYKVNNKYYTPLSYVGEYNIKATLKNLSVLDNNSGYWAGDWSLTFDGTKDESCQINVYGRLYNKSKYIYRPIDLNNPFPSRNAGINWYDWYSISNNKDKLKESYSDLEYSFNLNNEKLSNIKEYNNQKDIEGTGYYNWDDINNSESSFINEYAEKVGDNS